MSILFVESLNYPMAKVIYPVKTNHYKGMTNNYKFNSDALI